MIDPHVHLRDWNQAEKETVAHGLTEAKACGITAVFDMPNTDPPLTHRETVLRRLALAEPAEAETGVSYRLWAGLTPEPAQIKEVVSLYRELYPRVIGLKLFLGHSTGNMGICEYADQHRVFELLTELDYRGTVAVHAEKESLMHPERYVPGHFETHSLARPPEAEIESVRDVLEIVRDTGFRGNLHVCHVSTAGAVALIREAKKTLHVTLGVTPHHALFTAEDAADHNRYLKMNPPLREERDRAAVFTALLDGTADWIESDHAPHTAAEKEAGASGIPGLRNMVLLTKALKDAGCSPERLFALTKGRLREVFPGL